MYQTVLGLHSLLRWLVVLAGLWAVASAFGAARRREWTPADSRPGLLFVLGLDLQLLIGLGLFLVLSPVTRAAMLDMGAAMKSGASRFWIVEHPSLMIAAVALGHVGRVASRRAGSYRAGNRAQFWFALAIVAVLLATPWPFSSHPRPWFRLPF